MQRRATNTLHSFPPPSPQTPAFPPGGHSCPWGNHGAGVSSGRRSLYRMEGTDDAQGHAGIAVGADDPSRGYARAAGATASATVTVVTNTNDSGRGSLRQAISVIAES